MNFELHLDGRQYNLPHGPVFELAPFLRIPINGGASYKEVVTPCSISFIVNNADATEISRLGEFDNVKVFCPEGRVFEGDGMWYVGASQTDDYDFFKLRLEGPLVRQISP